MSVIFCRYVVLLMALLASGLPAVALADYSQHPQAEALVQTLVRDHQFNADRVRDLLSRVERRDRVIELISRPAEKVLTWQDYQKIFIKPKRIENGVAFWKKHAVTLDRLAETYGVPAWVMVSVIGIESAYGRHSGKHPVLASLATLAFDYPKRSRFFSSELVQFLVLAREESFDPLAVNGSYAGALGVPQFISSSYRHYAVDADGDNRRDLWGSMPDVMGSIANYFKRHGWRTGKPVAERVYPEGTEYQDLVTKKLKPTLNFLELHQVGANPLQNLSGKKTLYTLEGKSEPEVWVGHYNFYVITRYNHSKLYAMAVLTLGLELRRQMGLL